MLPGPQPYLPFGWGSHFAGSKPTPDRRLNNYQPFHGSTPRPARLSSSNTRDARRIQSACAALPISVRTPTSPNLGLPLRQSIVVVYFRRMAPKKTTLKEIGEMLSHVVKHMATKDDLAAVETRLDHRIDKLDAKLDRLDTKLTKFEEHEIDKRKQLEVRVSAIEKHLGLDKKIAA
jgi:hypothetical protein